MARTAFSYKFDFYFRVLSILQLYASDINFPWSPYSPTALNLSLGHNKIKRSIFHNDYNFLIFLRCLRGAVSSVFVNHWQYDGGVINLKISKSGLVLCHGIPRRSVQQILVAIFLTTFECKALCTILNLAWGCRNNLKTRCMMSLL